MSDSAQRARPAPPLSTYRLQLRPLAGAADRGHDAVDASGPGLGFAQAADLVGYLRDLGVSHLYLSPILQARPGSTHGYDVADPTIVSQDLGGEDGLRALARRAHEAGLGVVADIVPNHLGTGFATPLWRALLATGQSGPAGRVFDVDWLTPLPAAQGKVVVPVLAEQYGVVLAAGDLRLVAEDGEVRVAYFDHRFPLSPDSIEAVERAGDLQALCGTPGDLSSWGRLHALLDRQAYRLVHWRAGAALVNYRRFFSIDELAAVRVELDDVFERTHGTILRLVADGVLDGLRIDHPDGLRDPARYLQRLAERSAGTWTVVEKILAPEERLRRGWAAAGTTGYEFVNTVLGLFIDPAATETLDALDAEMGGDPRPYADQVRSAKHEMLDGELATDVRRIGRLLWELLPGHPDHRDTDDRSCVQALADVLCGFDVYRSYVDPQTGEASPEDVASIATAVGDARTYGSAPAHLYDFLEQLLSGRAGVSPAHLDVLARVQQLAGALTAKGVEDTVFYRYRRLLAVNEVGGEPAQLGISLDDFHARGARAPRAAMTTTATHDTKRGEDARLRIAALSEMPRPWAAAVRRWQSRSPAPDRQTALAVFQTLVGVWGSENLRERVQAFLQKAGREAKQQTSWRDPNAPFETDVTRYVDGLLSDAAFCSEMDQVAGSAAQIAMVAGLAQVVLRCTWPGVPDTYQGTELWDLNLVDPDNRRPVDFAARAALLRALDDADPADLLRNRGDGRIKLWVLSRSLRARRDHSAAVGAQGGYEPLRAAGRLAEHVVAFARGDASAGLLVPVVPRLPGGVMAGRGAPPTGEVWRGTSLALPADGRWHDVLTGRTLQVQGPIGVDEVLDVLPVALLATPS